VDLLRVEELTLAIGDRTLLHDVSLRIAPGETHVLFGANGSGKTALLNAVMGLPRYQVESGRIFFLETDVTPLSADERARLGIGIFYQRPPIVPGVTLSEMTRICLGARRDGSRIREIAGRLEALDLLERNVHSGFSGGEIKKAEFLQLIARNPRLALIDEPDSGVDLGNLDLLGRALRDLMKERSEGEEPHGALIVTHTGRILRDVPAARGHVLARGTLVCEDEAMALLERIERQGYKAWQIEG
jgi:Fe-S cluster assembly ATP-binding protein